MHFASLDSSAPRALRRYALSALLVVAATWLELLITGSAASLLSLTPFALSVALSVWLGGFGPGVLAVLLSWLALDFFIVGPGAILDFQSSADALVLSGYATAWLAFCLVARRVYP